MSTTDQPIANADGELITVKPFQQFLLEQRGGGLHGELSERLAELVAAVAQHDKGGTLTLTVSVKPVEGAATQYVVTDDVKVNTH